MVAEKLNLSKSDKEYYSAKENAQIIELGDYPYLTIEGKGAPESSDFADAIGKVYKVAYTIKFMQKAENLDFVVPKMESEWFIDGDQNNQKNFSNTPREQWKWKIHIRMPISVSEQIFNRAIQEISTKKSNLDVTKVKYEIIRQGKSVHCLHIGSYDDEECTLAKIDKVIQEEKLTITGYHKEIYLNDPRKTTEEKLRTIIRYPVSQTLL